MTLKNQLFLSIVLIVICAANAHAGCRIEQKTMPCTLLTGITEREFSICLPASYDSNSEKEYPVLYLLHGGGDHHTSWEKSGNLSLLMDQLVANNEVEEMIVVCPEACKDRMIWFNAPDWKFEDYFFQEFIPYIENHYRVKSEKRYRAVAGLSMGGGAATVYGLHRPEMFNVVYEMSGYLRRQEMGFAKSDSAAEYRQRNVEENNPIKTVENGNRETIRNWRTVRWMVDCGDQDFTLEANMDLVKAFRKQGIDYRMHVDQGGHNWNYWGGTNGSLKKAILYFNQQMYKSKVIDNGGRGDYSAIAITEKTLPNHVVYRPKDIVHAATTEHRLPVLVFANGGCNNTSLVHERVLNEIASHGYVVIALGDMQMRIDDRFLEKSPDSQIYEALDWIVAANADSTSDYYQCIDVDNIAVGGQSCGGAQVINVAADPRIKTCLMYNSGIGDMEMNGATQEKLKNFHGPVLYILGDDEDIAYNNAIKDYERIHHVPVAFANLKDAGHTGTFDEPYGGSFSHISIQWLDWQLKNRLDNSVVFLNNQLDNYPGWSIQTKKFKKVRSTTTR